MQTPATVLDVIRERGRKGLPLERLYRQLFNPGLFLTAYANLYSNAGAMTKGITQETADAMSMAKIRDLIELLRFERFRWTPVRRVEIPKKNGRTRPLGIPSWTDKLLQEVLRLLLEAYYEPQFSDRSHGFRPKRSTHTALMQVQNTGIGTRWFIEGDIKACFDRIDHQILLSILREKILDNRFLRLVEYLLKAGYCEEWFYKPTVSGTPQGGIVSPLLANLYLDRLDQFVEKTLIPSYTKGKTRNENPEYLKARRREQRCRKEGKVKEARWWQKAKRRMPSQDPYDPNYRRLSYARYADDFLLCFVGPKVEAEEIKETLRGFLLDKLKLELSEEKTLVTNAATSAARFLNYEISKGVCNSKLDWRKHRSVNGKLSLKAPRDVVTKALEPYRQGSRAIRRPEMTGMSDLEIVKRYQSRYRGLVNYYRLAGNLSIFGKLCFVMETSLLLTLASKFKTRVSEMLRKYKRKVQTPQGLRKCIEVIVERPGKKPLTARFGGVSLKRHLYRVATDPVLATPLRPKELIRRLKKGICELCSRKVDVQVHQIRKLRDLKRSGVIPDWAKLMLAIRRKTLVLCWPCHAQVHGQATPA